MKFLFAGGCHVQGYPFGADHSFCSLFGKRIEGPMAVEVILLEPIKMSHIAKVIGALDAHDPRVVVLQLGHFETSKQLSPYVKQRLRLPGAALLTGASASDASSGLSSKSLANRFSGEPGKPWWYVRQLGRYTIDVTLGHKLADIGECLRQFETLLNSMRDRVSKSGTHVLVLAPFPCADWTIATYRRELARGMQPLAEQAGFAFLHFDADKGRRFCGGGRLFHDSIHLSKVGHEWVCAEIWNHPMIQNVITGSRSN